MFVTPRAPTCKHFANWMASKLEGRGQEDRKDKIKDDRYAVIDVEQAASRWHYGDGVEVPRADVCKHVETLRSQIARRENLRSRVEVTTDTEPHETIIINHRTAMVHRPRPWRPYSGMVHLPCPPVLSMHHEKAEISRHGKFHSMQTLQQPSCGKTTHITHTREL